MNSFDSFVIGLPLAPGVVRVYVNGSGLSEWRLKKRSTRAQAIMTLLEQDGQYSLSLRLVTTHMPTYRRRWPLYDPTLDCFILAHLSLHGFIAVDHTSLVDALMAHALTRIINA